MCIRDRDQPVLVDHYITGKELETDAVCDGENVYIPGIMEHVERTGVHSGDSISVYPTFSVSEKARQTIIDYTVRLGLGIGIVGLYNIQFIVDRQDNVYAVSYTHLAPAAHVGAQGFGDDGVVLDDQNAVHGGPSRQYDTTGGAGRKVCEKPRTMA